MPSDSAADSGTIGTKMPFCGCRVSLREVVEHRVHADVAADGESVSSIAAKSGS